MTYWINGEFRDDPLFIDIKDRGFLLGDGAFETILVVKGMPAFLDKHIGRLKKTLEVLNIQHDETIKIQEIIQQLAERNRLQDKLSSARLTVTRGSGSRGLVYNENDNFAPTALLTLETYKSPSKTPAKLLISEYIRSERSLSSRHKTINYLDNLMARNEAANIGCDDAIMLNSLGRVACASAANIFSLTPDGQIFTPPVSDGALPGIVRGVLLDRAPGEGLQIQERSILPEELGKSGIFLTNSLIGIRPAYLGGAEPGSQDDKISRLKLLYIKILGEVTKEKARDH